MFGIGAPELLIVLLIVLILFGGAKLPELSRSLGSAIKEFKDGINSGDAGKEVTHKEEKSDSKNG